MSLGTVLSAASAGVTLEVFLDEAKARNCYAHSFDMKSNDFVRMLLHDACYLLHLLHMHLTPTLSSRTTGNKVAGKQRPFCRWRSATEYYYAGVGFRSRPLVGRGARSILDVKLDGRGGTLEIPRLKIDADTSRLLRNLMALEQSNPTEAGSHVTAYCVFLLVLARDHRARPRQPRRGRRRKGVAFDLDGSYLCATWQGLDDWAAWLMLRYSSNPWLPVAAVGCNRCTLF
jgi:hypothetical protein